MSDNNNTDKMGNTGYESHFMRRLLLRNKAIK